MIQIILCCYLSAYALNFVSKNISLYICRIFDHDDIENTYSRNFILINFSVHLVLGFSIYFYTKIQDYQNYSKLIIILISAIYLAIICALIEVLICVYSDFSIKDTQQKYLQLYHLYMEKYLCKGDPYDRDCITHYLDDYKRGEKKLISINTLGSAMVFQIYYLQVIQILHPKYGEHNAFENKEISKQYQGRRVGLEIGIIVTIIMTILYASFLVILQTNSKD